MSRAAVFCCLNNKSHKIIHFCTKRKFYWILAALRILLNFIPQTGYIHPDEYFQFIEVASGMLFLIWNLILIYENKQINDKLSLQVMLSI